MKITLELENEKELRDYVKEMIEGQVKAIVREELEKEVQSILKERLSNVVQGTLLENALAKAAKSVLVEDFGISSWNVKFIEPAIESHLDKIFSSDIVRSAANRAINEKISKIVNIVKDIGYE